MKSVFTSSRLFILGFIIIALTNIIILSGVAFNKTGTKESHITLTQRELKPPYWTNRENSGSALKISWQSLGQETYNRYSGWRYPFWLNEKKLKELGFNMNTDDHKKLPISKEVFVVLEYNGNSYNKALNSAQAQFKEKKKLYETDRENREAKNKFDSAKKQLERVRVTQSRLFAVDAGLNPEKLRTKYKDRSHFIITKAIIKPRFNSWKDKKEITGQIQKLSTGNIHVSLKHGKILKSILKDKKSNRNDIVPPRYKVELAYGSRFEPWIISVEQFTDNHAK